MEKIYLIGGLGVDERVFTNIHFKNYEKQVIKWLEPLPNEPLPDYCKRLLPQITSENPVIAGVSFGGMVSNEISKLIPVKKVILISSIRSWHEMPWYFTLSGRINLHRLVPMNWVRKSTHLLRWLFWVYDKENQKLLSTIAGETSPVFLKWAVNAAVTWRGEERDGFWQIHSNKDRTFPLRYIKHPDVVLKGTGHLMVVQKAAQVAEEIDAMLAKM